MMYIRKCCGVEKIQGIQAAYLPSSSASSSSHLQIRFFSDDGIQGHQTGFPYYQGVIQKKSKENAQFAWIYINVCSP